MSLTIFGLAVAGICIVMLVLKRPITEFYAGLLVSAVFGAAEAVALPMLGGASLTVPYFFVLFVIVRLLFLGRRKPILLGQAIGANIWLLLLAIYGVITAMTMPRLLEGAMSVFAMRPLPYRTLLTFTSQNITQSVYLVLTALTAIAAYATARHPKSDDAIRRGWKIAAVAFVAFGLIDLAGFYVGAKPMDWARTASYTIVSQSEMGIRRISGSFSEPSSFAGFGAVPLSLFSYLWLANIRSTVSGLLALSVAGLMLLSTSTTAFSMLAVVFLVIAIGIVLTPMSPVIRQKKFVSLCGAILVCIALGIALSLLMPQFAASFAEIIEKMTVGKAKSASGIERGIWAAQGFDAFRISRGIGIGPGSFRSSGLMQAAIGSVGAFGVFCFMMYFGRLVLMLFKAPRLDRPLIVAYTLTAILMLVPPLTVGPAPDPGILFGATAGFAIGRQRRARIESALLEEDGSAGPARKSRRIDGLAGGAIYSS